MQSHLCFPDHIHACHLDNVWVFLDTESGTYKALRGQASALLTDILDPKAVCPDAGEAGKLCKTLMNEGLLCSSSSRPHRICPEILPPPIGSIHDGQPPTGKTSLRIGYMTLLQSLMRCVHLKRYGSFQTILNAAKGWKSDCSGNKGNMLYEAIDLTRHFHQLTPLLFSRRDACFFRSLLLLKCLCEHGIASSWVFGVRVNPFCAHCWLEYDGLVLNDHLDTVLAYKKIMAV